MTLLEEITNLDSALDRIEVKDWYRARTVARPRIKSMLNAIRDPRKIVGRVLAIYFYYKFARDVDYITVGPGQYNYLSDFTRMYLRGLVSDNTLNDIFRLTAKQVYPYVYDTDVLTEMKNRQNFLSPSEQEPQAFFGESRKLAESLLLSKEDLNKKLNELRDEFPEKFADLKDENLGDILQQISIDYLDGCTDLDFDNDTTVDITDNSTDVTNHPAYEKLMRMVFEEVVDDWLKEHNLTHKDITWFTYNPKTQQMFIQFEANNVDLTSLDESYTLLSDSNEDDEQYLELEEEYSSEALGELEKQIAHQLSRKNVHVEDLFLENFSDIPVSSGEHNIIKLTVLIDGDWKWDHLQAHNIINKILEDNKWSLIKNWEEVTINTGRDDYTSYHYWVFYIPEEEPAAFFKEDFINEENLKETYSEEELDNLLGKTFNQQKIQNIYRRKKYNDSRLFAHTKCVNCGREKRVFLSNLVNDPEKYGSCTCSDTNVETRLDNIQDLFSGQKKLSSNTSGYTGVSYVRTYKGKLYDKWRAYIEIDGKRTYLGDFDSKSAAIKARKKAAEKGLKWYREHKNEFMKNYRKKSKRYRKSHK